MADNVIADPGAAGATFATDDVGGVHFPRSKQVWGADGVATDVAAGAAALPIQDGGNTITVDGSVSLAAALPAGTANIGDVDVLTVPAPLSTTGGGTEAAALRVTIANDSTGVVSVDDNGASLTVDSGQLPAALTGGGNLKISLAESTASQAVTGTVTANAGTGTFGVQDTASKVDDAAFAPGTDRVLVIGAQADETGPDSVDEGDAGALRMTLARGLHVNLRDASGAEVSVGGGTQYTEDAAAEANPVGTALNLIRQDALSGLTTTDGDNVAARGTDKGELYVKHADAIPITDNAGSLTVDGSVSLAAAIPAGTNNIGDVDVLTVPAPLSTSGGGTEATALRVTIATDSTGVVSVDDNGGALTVDGTVAISTLPASTNTLEVVGDAAHDAAVAGNPVLIGVEARTTDGTAVASGDVVRPVADTLGKQVVLIGALTDLRVNGKGTFTNTTAADLIAALASNKYVVTSVAVTNAHATVGTKVEIRAGTTVKMQQFAAANGGGWALHDPGGLFETAANEAVTARNVTTGADTDVFVAGFKRTN